jgi:hypothetical protein
VIQLTTVASPLLGSTIAHRLDSAACSSCDAPCSLEGTPVGRLAPGSFLLNSAVQAAPVILRVVTSLEPRMSSSGPDSARRLLLSFRHPAALRIRSLGRELGTRRVAGALSWLDWDGCPEPQARYTMVGDYNGWNDAPEDEREALDLLESTLAPLSLAVLPKVQLVKAPARGAETIGRRRAA